MERKEEFKEIFKGVKMDTVLAKFRYLGMLQAKKAEAFGMRFKISDEKYPFDGEEFEFPENSVEAAEELVEAIGEDEFRAEEEAREQFRLVLKKTEKKQEQIIKHSLYRNDDFQDNVIRIIKGFPSVADIKNDDEMLELLITAMDMAVDAMYEHSLEVLRTLAMGLGAPGYFLGDDEDWDEEEDSSEEDESAEGTGQGGMLEIIRKKIDEIDAQFAEVDDMIEEYECKYGTGEEKKIPDIGEPSLVREILDRYVKAGLVVWASITLVNEIDEHLKKEAEESNAPKGPVRIATPHGYVNKPNNESTGK